MKRTFIFDYDDTLAWNQHDYSYPQIMFLEWVVNRLGRKAPDPQTIINLQVEIDRDSVENGKGWGMERFPSSLRRCYEKICEGAGIDDPEGLKHAYDIGMQAFNEERWKQQGLVDGAEDTLDFLVEK